MDGAAHRRGVHAHLLDFSQHKFASNVVEKCLQYASKRDRDEMICSLTVQGIGQFVYPNCASLTRTYTFPTEGTYKVTLEVIDESRLQKLARS